MDSIEGRVDRIEEAVARLTNQIAGDGTALSPGVVGVLERNTRLLDRHDQRIGIVEKTVDRTRWTVTGGATVGGILGGGIIAVVARILGVS